MSGNWHEIFNKDLGSYGIINSSTIYLKPNNRRYKFNVGVYFSNFSYRVGIGISIKDDGGNFVVAKTEWFTLICLVTKG